MLSMRPATTEKADKINGLRGAINLSLISASVEWHWNGLHYLMDGFMNADAHISTLQQRHAALERAISEESHRPSPDQVILQELKRRKLQLKDEIARATVG